MKYLNIVARRMHACMNLYCGRDATAIKSKIYKLGRSKLKFEHINIKSYNYIRSTLGTEQPVMIWAS